MSAESTRSGLATRASKSPQVALRRIVQRLPDGIVIVDGAGTIRFVNPAAEALFGQPAKALVGADFGHSLVPGEATEIEIVRKGGATIVAELRLVELIWEDEPASLVSLRDITDRRAAEARAAELAREQKARIEAEATSQAKSEFLAMMSHELRTPLNAVLGYAELLDLGIAGPLTDAQRQQLRRISASGKHLLGLVNAILDLATVEAGRLEVRSETPSAWGPIEAAVMLTMPLAEERGVALRPTGDAARGVYFRGDLDRTRQILVNLLSNAVKFTEPGGSISVQVDVVDAPERSPRLHGERCWVAFRVRDTGVGIAPEQIDAIFAPFVQANAGHTRRKDGSGLGLTISRRLARLMGGDLTAESTVGEGSTFTLWLPVAADNAVSADVGVTLSGREPRVQGLTEVGESLLRDTDSILDAFVARLRAEPALPSAKGLRFTQLADHVTTLIADIAGSLVVIEDSQGEPTPLLADAADIQRFVADRHGAQRARLAWTPQAVAREYELLREEIEGGIRRRFPGDSGTVQEALAVVNRQLQQAAEISARACERASQEPDAT